MRMLEVVCCAMLLRGTQSLSLTKPAHANMQSPLQASQAVWRQVMDRPWASSGNPPRLVTIRGHYCSGTNWVGTLGHWNERTCAGVSISPPPKGPLAARYSCMH